MRRQWYTGCWRCVGTKFARETTAHGFVHVFEEGRSNAERTFWAVMLCLAIWGTIKINLSPWRRYQENPTVISIERDYDNWNISFPTVTLCPLKKYNLTAIQNFTSQNNKMNISEELANFLKLLPGLTYSTFNQVAKFGKDYIDPSEYLNVIHKIRYELRYFLESSADSERASVTETVNEQGFCFTFVSNVAAYNSYQYLTSSFWDEPHEGNAVASNYLSGSQMTLSDLNSGFEVYAHSADEPAEMTSLVETVGNDKGMRIHLQASVLRATPEVAALRLSQRHCRFPWESPLPTTPVYSQAACRLYCRQRLAHRLCGCKPHFYKTIDKYPVCGVAGMQCLFENRHLLLTLAENKTGGSDCSCLPQCESVKYLLTNSEKFFNWHLGAQFTWTLDKFPRLRMRRDVIFGFTDLLVSTGGSLGLFLGCSVLTLAEVLYILIYRSMAAVLCKLLRKKM